MCNFSNKYSIKIDTNDNIIDLLNNSTEITSKDIFDKSELYFIKNTVDISKKEKFSDISNYIVITVDKEDRYIKLCGNKSYKAPLDDILSVSELLLLFDYEIIFSIVRKLYQYNYNNINFYIQVLRDKTFVLTFDKYIHEEKINNVICFFKDKLNINLNKELYFNITEQEFFKLKK